MTAIGLKGESKKEVLDIIKAPNEKSLQSTFKKLFATQDCPLKVANKMLVHKKLRVRKKGKTALKVGIFGRAIFAGS